MSLRLSYLNVTTINSVIYASWNMNATVNQFGGANITIDTLYLNASNTANGTLTGYTLTNLNINTTSTLSGSIRTYNNTGLNVTLYDTNTGVNRLNLSASNVYSIYAYGEGTSSPIGPYPPALLTSNTLYATGSPITVSGAMCFLKGMKLLCADGIYRAIEDLRKGMSLKTFCHGDVAIEMIGFSKFSHSLGNEKRDRLYVYKKDEHSELTEDLIVTGGHSALVDHLTQKQVEDVTSVFGGTIFMTDSKFRLPACVDDRAHCYAEEECEETVYHVCLENDNPSLNYGIWANGMLMETCHKECISEMTLIE